MNELIKKYIDYLRYEKNYSLHTEISYSKDLLQFVDYLREVAPDVDSFVAVDSDLIRGWVAGLMQDGVSARSVNRKLSALKSFFKYLIRIGVVCSNPLRKISGPKISKPIPSFVPDQDMQLLLNDDLSVVDADFESVRNRMILELFYVSGLRRAELIGLRDVDVDIEQGNLLVNGKRNKQRIIPLSRKTCSFLADYLAVRNRSVNFFSGYFFVCPDGKPVYPMLVYRVVSEALRFVPTLSKTSPHVLRHTFATSMLNGGADINAVKELLGHASLAATEVYTHTSFEELKKIYKQAHPRA